MLQQHHIFTSKFTSIYVAKFYFEVTIVYRQVLEPFHHKMLNLELLLVVLLALAQLSASNNFHQRLSNHRVSRRRNEKDHPRVGYPQLHLNKRTGYILARDTTDSSLLHSRITTTVTPSSHDDNPASLIPSTDSSVPAPDIHSDGHKMSLRDLVINICADLLPHGAMPLAYGFSRGPSGIVPSLAMLVGFGSCSASTMIMYARLATSTKSKTIGELWGKIISRRTEWIVDLSIFSLCFGCCVFYSAFIGDIFGALASVLSIGGVAVKRWMVLTGITSFVLLPLCMLEDLSALQFSSLVGFAGILYTALFQVWRLSDGSYRTGGKMLPFVEEKMLPHWPEQKFSLWHVNTGTLVLANMLCLAFLSHYNAISYFRELEGSSIERYRVAIRLGFGISMLIFGAMMFVGYNLFGAAAQPLLLNNFPKSRDVMASAARVATGLAITFAYPLMFAGLKSSLFSLINAATAPRGSSSPEQEGEAPPAAAKRKRPMDLDKRTQQVAVLASIVLITAIAIQCGEEDVGFILGIVGSVLGCLTAYILPATLRLSQKRRRDELGLSISLTETVASYTLIAVGLVFGACGVWITIKNEMEKGHGHGH